MYLFREEFHKILANKMILASVCILFLSMVFVVLICSRVGAPVGIYILPGHIKAI